MTYDGGLNGGLWICVNGCLDLGCLGFSCCLSLVGMRFICELLVFVFVDLIGYVVVRICWCVVYLLMLFWLLVGFLALAVCCLRCFAVCVVLWFGWFALLYCCGVWVCYLRLWNCFGCMLLCWCDLWFDSLVWLGVMICVFVLVVAGVSLVFDLGGGFLIL